MPTLPATDGLPVWAQILVSILICVATLAVSLKGYFGGKNPSEQSTTSTTNVGLAAILGDLGSVRHLSDVTIQNNHHLLELTKAVNDLTHYERNSVEALEELCGRVRALTETIERRTREESNGWGNK